MRRGQSQKMNYWMRIRVLMQGLTIVAIVGGVHRLGGVEGIWAGGIAEGNGAGGKRGEQELVDRAEFRGRLKQAEEVHRLESGGGSIPVENQRGARPGQQPSEREENRKRNGFWHWIWIWGSSNGASGDSTPSGEKSKSR
jgi:hypothetical protein